MYLLIAFGTAAAGVFQLELAINCTWSNVRVRSNKLWMFGSSVADSRISARAGGGQQHLCPAVNFRSRGLFLLLSQCSLHSLPPSLQNVDQHLFTLPPGYGQFAFGFFDDSFELPFGSNVQQAEDNRDSENRREREHQSRHRYGARQPRARLATRRASGRHEGVPSLEG